MSIFSDNLKKFRKLKNFKQKEIAEMLEIDTSTYSNYENGKREPNILTIKKIAKILNVSGDDLLGIKSKEKNKHFLNNREMSHISKYRKLNEPRQNRVDKITDMELEEQEEETLKSSSSKFLKG
ncbi:DNA-binding helix-turn-helix protein [Anaerofustis stercorihominis DSM 17244]|uniref:DNA-binding helix-turn-helix protein n=1 Tax=Anaerofustis stercorihominis DSM 17244 TaxID=445971 RepID=B1C7I6_9FIRM|nr:helix-turn-helix transcriptional regulator [Anaerofustis stercorihominis]EDS72973.1 DNA-binding helix-turn-helix protein [Anaerofustis stercorihominis DSM 17244]